MTTPEHHGAEAGCGLRLRKAREAAQLSVGDVAARLKMPVRVVESLEAEDWGRLGAPVFVRGQLRSYARLLGLATAPMYAASGVGPVVPVQLQPRTFTPPMQRLAEQFARRAVYIVITAALAIPVWVATRTHLAVPVQGSSSLDLPATPAGDASATAVADAAPSRSAVVASMAPMPPPAQAASGLSIEVSGDSWLEVVGNDGRTLEESIVRAGERRVYAPGQVRRVVIGNVEGVKVHRRGVTQDLSAFRRANIARFTVSSDGSLQPVSE